MNPVRAITIGRLHLANNLILAPMAGYTQRALRVLSRRYGASLAWTEMISDYEILRPGRKTRRLLKIVPEDGPLGLQIFGTDVRQLADAAARAADMGCFAAVDLNMACPVRKMLTRGNGGAQLREPDAALRRIEAVRKACRLPLSIKVRRGFDDSAGSRRKVVELLTGAEALGIDAVTIHGRTVEQIYHGAADWQFIYEMAGQLALPVFGSGDLLTAEAVIERLCDGPVAGAALARGAVGSPWIFRDVLHLASGRAVEPVAGEERVRCMWDHYAMLVDELGEYTAIRIMRRFGMFYSKGIDRAREARLALGKIKTRDDLERVVAEFFA
jgi:nifR3 family TIM-barrel protein